MSGRVSLSPPPSAIHEGDPRNNRPEGDGERVGVRGGGTLQRQRLSLPLTLTLSPLVPKWRVWGEGIRPHSLRSARPARS